MGQPYVGEIRLFGGSFNPNGWAFCNGALLPISENDVLFQLIGTTYGGDGQSTFGLPDLQGRVPIHMGQGPGISQNYQLGEKSGVESVTLTTNQLPAHNHSLVATSSAADTNVPTNALLGGTLVNYYFPFPATAAMAPQALGPTGGSQPHDNMMPYLVVSFIISLFGIFPNQ